MHDNIIMAGDWNTIQNCTLDKKCGNEKGRNTVVDRMTELLGQFDILDKKKVFRWTTRNILAQDSH